MERCDAVEGGDSSDGEWEEEYIMAVIPGKGLVSPSSRISIAGIETSSPLVQIDDKVFRGTCKSVASTDLFFPVASPSSASVSNAPQPTGANDDAAQHSIAGRIPRSYKRLYLEPVSLVPKKRVRKEGES